MKDLILDIVHRYAIINRVSIPLSVLLEHPDIRCYESRHNPKKIALIVFELIADDALDFSLGRFRSDEIGTEIRLWMKEEE